MKKVLFFAVAAMFLASCSNNQETADKAKIDSMSQELARQHIIDSMNNVSAAVGASPVEMNVPSTQGRVPSSQGRSHSNTRANHAASTEPAGASASNPVAPAVANTATQPTAEELAAKKKANNKKLLNSTAAGAMIGAGAGAIGGAVAGKNDHFKKEDALIGGGLGAVLGAGTGYLLQKHKQKKDTTK